MGSERALPTARPSDRPAPARRRPDAAVVDNQRVQDALRGGEPLPPQPRRLLEPTLGRDLGGVRLHADAAAAELADRLDAEAFALGEHIGFAAGRFAPDTAAGRRLIAHEVQHTRQPGRSVVRRQPRRGAADPNLLEPSPQPPAAMTHAEFDGMLRRRFGVQRIATGTEDEQRTLLTPRGGAPPGGVVLPGWQAWDPGASSTAYASILASLEDTARSLGGLPAISEVLFLRTHYIVGANGIGVAEPSTGASFGAGHLSVHETAVSGNKGLPTGRSTVTGAYPPVVIGLAPRPGEIAGAPQPAPTREQHIRRILTHELGHGVAEAAMAADMQTFIAYARAVGWSAGALFDIGQSAAAQALAAGTPPPPALRITPERWNDPAWVEQPVSRYMVEGGPGEDFAEAVMAYVQEPALLQARSPARFRFVAANRDRWLPQLMRLPQVGDFPAPPRDRVPA